MKRTPMKRGGPLKRKTPLRRKKPTSRSVAIAVGKMVARLNAVASGKITGTQKVSPAPMGGTAKPKTQRVLDSGWLAVVRAMPCAFCGKAGPSDAHHFPPKSRTGVQVDVLTVPACRECHERAQKYEISRQDQASAVAFTIASVINEAMGAVESNVLRIVLKNRLIQVLTGMVVADEDDVNGSGVPF